MSIDSSEGVQDSRKESILEEIRKEVIKVFSERGSLDSVTENMGLVKLRQLHQVLFDEAIEAGKEKLGDDFHIDSLRKKLDNTYEHMLKNLCSLPIDVCTRNNCDNYDQDCVVRKIKDQINKIASEIHNPTSFVAPNLPSEQDLEDFLNAF